MANRIATLATIERDILHTVRGGYEPPPFHDPEALHRWKLKYIGAGYLGASHLR